MSSSKRSRSVNWDEEEKQLLRNVLKEYAFIIEDKSLNTNTNKNKTKAWEDVHKKFNALNCRQRELGQLKIQWKGMKVSARKIFGTFRQELNKTGGGARPVTPDNAIIEVKDLLNPAELLRDDNPFDSDGLDLKVTNDEVEGPTMDVLSFDNVSQGYEQDCCVITIEEIDIKADAQKTPSGNSENDVTLVTPLHTNMAQTTVRKVRKNVNYKNVTDRPGQDSVSKSSKNTDYVNTILSHTKILKEEEHRRRMEMAEEDHQLNIKIKQEQLNCAILERDILELRKAGVVKL